MYKNGQWARQLLSLQHEDGKWGMFHSLSQFSDAPVTTEQALRRLEILGFTREDECIQRALRYMDDCLAGRSAIPDRREKIHDWDVFTRLILATWIRRFTDDNARANEIAAQWADVVTAAFANGSYAEDAYVDAYHAVIRPKGGRLVPLMNFYPLSLVSGFLDPRTENALVDHAIHHPSGVYYLYDRRIADPPSAFQSREASRYLAAIELLARFRQARGQLRYVVDWLQDCRGENGRWDMGGAVNDKLYFPLSDNWRKKETREADCSHRLSTLISDIAD